MGGRRKVITALTGFFKKIIPKSKRAGISIAPRQNKDIPVYPTDTDAPPKRIALVLPPGDVTGGALQVGCLTALRDAGILEKIVFYSTGSVGALNAAMAMTGRIEELKELWFSLKPKDLFRPKSLITIIYSNIVAWLAATLEGWEENYPSPILKIRRPYYISKRVLVLAVILGLTVTFDRFPGLSFFVVSPGIILAIHFLQILWNIMLNGLWYVFRWGTPKILLGRFKKFLSNPELHTDSLNEFALVEKVAERLDIPQIQEEILQAPKKLLVATVNSTTWKLEVYAFGQGKAERIDVRPPESIDPHLIKDVIFASSSIPVILPQYPIKECWYYDCAGLKPMPLSYAFNADCDLILVVINEPDINDDLIDKAKPVTIFGAALRAIEINQREMVRRELQIAQEKSRDVRELKRKVNGIMRAVETRVQDPELRQLLLEDIKTEIAESNFSFRHDKDIPLILICPKWEPSLQRGWLGRFKDFSLIPAIINRGYEETMRVLKKENLIP